MGIWAFGHHWRCYLSTLPSLEKKHVWELKSGRQIIFPEKKSRKKKGKKKKEERYLPFGNYRYWEGLFGKRKAHERRFFLLQFVCRFLVSDGLRGVFCSVLGFRSLFLVVMVFLRWSFLPRNVQLFLGVVFKVVGIFSSFFSLTSLGA